jgi:2-isopropylmalate synthase
VSDRVTIFDTTLRDGEQAPGASMDLAQKLRVARILQQLSVDIIEAGFAAASPGDAEAVAGIAREIDGPVICCLARAERSDIDAAWRALESAQRKRLHIVLGSSPTHREYKLRMTKEQVVARATEAVRYARERFAEVEFSPEDAARTEPEFLVEVVARVVEAGATTVNIPDTVGYALPQQYGALIGLLRRTVRADVTISVHCHNDLGLAVANSLAGVEAGARQVECTINGIGERAGNCSLEEVVMALRTRFDHFRLRTGVRTEKLCEASRAVSQATGFVVQRNKAVVGENAFAHEAGIHQHGIMNHAATYEIMRPEDVGFPSTRLVLGKHSGRHLLVHRLEQLGYHLEGEQVVRVFDEFKRVADHRKEIVDADLHRIMREARP